MKSRKVITIIAMFLAFFVLGGCGSNYEKSASTSKIEKENKKIVITTKREEETFPEVTTTRKQEEQIGDVKESTTKDIIEEPQIDEGIQPDIKEDKKITVLPTSIMSTVDYWESIYPDMTIGVGLYSLDGTSGYEYNCYTLINSACTVKAAYALYVLQESERRGLDIWSTYLTYQEWHNDPEGSGDINLYGYYGAQYSIAELVRLLLQVSDNVAYNMLLDEFSLNDFYMHNSVMGGEDDWLKWGRATVNQRKNEWVAIWNYVNSDSLYSQVLREDLTGTQYAYFLEGMQNWHNYMQKSGWTEETPDYPATGEAAIIDDSYILIVLTQDYTDEMGHIEVLQSIGGAVESYWDANNGNIF